MGKKPDEGGAPAYMGLFTSLMTVLLAFFILMVSMADSQDAGFYHGVGSVQNTYGVKGGLGVMNFARKAGDKGMLGVSEENEDTNATKQLLFEPEGDGGLGTVDVDGINEVEKGVYISVFIPHTFEKGSTRLDPNSKLADYLKKMSIGFLSVKEDIVIRTYAEDGGNKTENQLLATKRANSIMKFLHSKGISYSRLTSTGYNYDRYFDFSEVDKQIRQTGQASYFYIYKKE